MHMALDALGSSAAAGDGMLDVTRDGHPSARIHVTSRGGEGRALVLVHGAGVDGSFFGGLASAFAGRHVVTYDRRGCGVSSDALDGDWSLDAQAADLAAVIRKAGAPADVVAHSLGSLVAMRALELAPALMARLVLIEPPLFVGLDPADPVFQNLVRAGQALAKGHTSTLFMLALERENMGDAIRPFTQDELAFRERDVQTHADHEASWMLAYKPDLARIRAQGVPVLLCMSERSASTYHARNQDFLARGMGADLMRLPGGHNAPRDYPDEVANRLSTWL